jgi:hypothetical protein
MGGGLDALHHAALSRSVFSHPCTAWGDFFWLLWPMRERVGLRWRLVAALVLEIGWELLANSTWVIERYLHQTESLDYRATAFSTR